MYSSRAKYLVVYTKTSFTGPYNNMMQRLAFF